MDVEGKGVNEGESKERERMMEEREIRKGKGKREEGWFGKGR